MKIGGSMNKLNARHTRNLRLINAISKRVPRNAPWKMPAIPIIETYWDKNGNPDTCLIGYETVDE